MDSIFVKSSDDMKRIIDWAKQFGKTNYDEPFVVPFESVEVKLADEELKFTMERKGDIFSMTVYCNDSSGEYLAVCGCKTNFSEYNSSKTVIIPGSEWYGGQTPQARQMIKTINTVNRTFDKQIQKFVALMLFAVYYSEEFEKTGTTVTTKLPPKKKKNGKRVKGSTQHSLCSRRYVISDEVTGSIPAPKRSYTKCEHEISVRGHKRRYKSGKEVWIKPFKKNVGKKKSDGNSYIA